jgi:hypothetical protein
MTTINLDIVLRALFNQRITLRKWTETERSGTFGTITRISTDYTIRGAVHSNPTEYSYWASLGGIDVGEARGYFFSSYEADTGEPPHGVAEPEDLIYVEESDYVIDINGIEWEISKITRHTEWGYTVVIADLRRRTT